MSVDNKIDLTEVDWSNLSVDAFNSLHKTLSVDKKPRKKRTENNKFTTVSISGKVISITEQEYIRLKAMKNQKSKDKFKNQLIEKYQEIKSI